MRPGPTTPNESRRISDDQVDQLLGNLLRLGVVIATVVAVIGGVLHLAHHGMEPTGHREFHGEPPQLRSVGGIIRAALSFQTDAVVQLGLLLLIATPVARVAMSLVAFILQRDRVYVVVTSLVLALLLFSLMGGISH